MNCSMIGSVSSALKQSFWVVDSYVLASWHEYVGLEINLRTLTKDTGW